MSTVYLKQVYFDCCDHCRENHFPFFQHTIPCNYCGQDDPTYLHISREEYTYIRKGEFEVGPKPTPIEVTPFEADDANVKRILDHIICTNPYYKDLVRYNNKIAAIKYLRNQAGCGLRAAKEAIERAFPKEEPQTPNF